MADPMRIRAQAAGDKTTVRVLMAHEMEGGQRKDAAGKIVPAWYIQEVTATHNGNIFSLVEKSVACGACRNALPLELILRFQT